MKILYTSSTKLYLSELVETLYYNNYFGSREFAKDYVDSITKAVEATIHIKKKHPAPPHFSQYGDELYYVTYPKNKRTTWYFFFTYHPTSDIYYIRYITNNHAAGHLLTK